MADEPGNRYSNLLQPIRDLSRIWNIEVADELEKYIEEVASFAFGKEGNKKKVNFAEAALLIQGSTSVYSRKVEQLHALVYQALDRVNATTKEKTVDARGRKKLPSGLWDAIPDTDELLTIDHLIKEGRNIVLDDAALLRQEKRQALNRRIPMFLMPRERSDEKEFRISSCTVHRSGAHLIQESDTPLLEAFLATEGTVKCIPLAPPPPSEVRDLDEQLQLLLRGGSERPELPEESKQPELPEASWQPSDADVLGEACDLPTGVCDSSPLSDLPQQPQRPQPERIPEDPWALLDENAQVGRDVPPELGSSTRRFGSKGLLMKGEGLPNLGNWEPLSDQDLWQPGCAAQGLSALLVSGHPVKSLFRVVGTHLRSGGRTMTEKAGLSAAWLDFEDLFQAASSKRRKLDHSHHTKAKLGAAHQGQAPNTPPSAGFGGLDSDDDLQQEEVLSPLGAFAADSSPLRTDFGLMSDMNAEQRQQVARLEGLIEDAQSQYESSIRTQLQLTQGGADANSQQYPELYENVRKWQEQLAPVLKEFDSHPAFDINVSGSHLIGKMVSMQKSGDEEKTSEAIPFSRLVHGQPGWEVCRRFLTCLMLTNQGNTDIVFASEEERINNFGVKLLKTETPQLSFHSEAPPAEVSSTASCVEQHDKISTARSVATPLRQGSKRSNDSFEGTA